MSQHHPPGAPPGNRRTTWTWAALGVVTALTTAGCDGQSNMDTLKRGWLPGTDSTTSMSRNIRDLWVGSWVAALAVGVLVWGLTIYCAIHFRRRKGETGLPPQLRYNVPLEILYTLVPLFMIGVLFFYTARDQIQIEDRYAKPQVHIEVVGKRWAWDFNYRDSGVYDTGIQAQRTSAGIDEAVEDTIPTLYLPVNQKIEISERSRDVAHSFYVPAFNYKKDVIPGRTNYWSLTPTKQGTYIGRCAELCGEYHSQMLFKVRVVSAAAYRAHLAHLKAIGQTGYLSADLGQNHTNPGLTQGNAPSGQGEGTITNSGDNG